ncbi:MAG: methyltransferase domain-containing protein [Patescibacteria group bacterium]
MYILIFYTFVISLILLLGALHLFALTQSTIFFLLVLASSIIFILLFAANILMLASMIHSMLSGAFFAPTPLLDVRKMISLANLSKKDLLLDIGSGDGRIIFEAAKTGAKCVGIEVQPLLAWWSKRKLKRLGLTNAEIIKGNFWQRSFSDVDILTLFFIPHKMKKLYEKIQNEMKPGSRVISYYFQFPDWQYFKKDDKVYLYLVNPRDNKP